MTICLDKPNSTEQPLYMGTKFLHVNWSDYDKKMMQLKEIIDASGWEFNQIVCIARGGLTLGAKLSHHMDKPLGIIIAKSYKGENEMSQGKLVISKIATIEALGNKILLLDDLVDSGETMPEIIKHIRMNHPEVEIRTGVLWYKTSSKYEPDYYVDTVVKNETTDTWIVQPFEKS